MRLVGRLIWPGLRIMLLPIALLLSALSTLLVLATAGSLFMGLSFYSISETKLVSRTLLDAWLLGSAAAASSWLGRQMRLQR